jgi:8-oxo-dGTP pyrophosphatase MutT (NUDIX family)
VIIVLDDYSASMNTAPVTIKGVCLDAGRRVLLCRNHRSEWELPGGRPELREAFSACLVREIEEETGLTVTEKRSVPGRISAETSGSSPTRHFRCYFRFPPPAAVSAATSMRLRVANAGSVIRSSSSLRPCFGRLDRARSA